MVDRASGAITGTELAAVLRGLGDRPVMLNVGHGDDPAAGWLVAVVLDAGAGTIDLHTSATGAADNVAGDPLCRARVDEAG